tara:strand:+ start:453 stop:875 length:423 start_codon:yes stop_codon:yes gene_type:complete
MIASETLQFEDDSIDQDGPTGEEVQHIATQLTELCKQYVAISDQLNDLQKQRKEFTQVHKELATRITSYMQMVDVDEVNCGTKHKILLQDKKSTTGMKINDISAIIQSKEISQNIKNELISDIKNSRVTTLKPSIKLKNI